MVLLDGGRHQARHADPIATHDDRLVLAFDVEVRGRHLRSVVRAEQEDVPGLDPAVKLEGRAAVGARIAVHDLAHFHDLSLEITAVLDVQQVEIGLVGARSRRRSGPRRRRRSRPRPWKATGPANPELGAGLLHHVRRRGQVHLVHAQGARELHLVHVVVAPARRPARAPCRPSTKGSSGNWPAAEPRTRPRLRSYRAQECALSRAQAPLRARVRAEEAQESWRPPSLRRSYSVSKPRSRPRRFAPKPETRRCPSRPWRPNPRSP